MIEVKPMENVKITFNKGDSIFLQKADVIYIPNRSNPETIKIESGVITLTIPFENVDRIIQDTTD